MNGYIRVEKFWEHQNADAWKKAQQAKRGNRRHPNWCKLVVTRDYEMDRLSVPTRLLFIELLRLATSHTNVIPNDPEWIAKQISMDSEQVSQGIWELRKGAWINVTRSGRLSREILENIAPRSRSKKGESPKSPNGNTDKLESEAMRAALRWLNGHGWDDTYDKQAILEEAGRVVRKSVIGWYGKLNEAALLAEWERLYHERYEPPDEVAA